MKFYGNRQYSMSLEYKEDKSRSITIMKKIKQINNFVIEQDTARQISYFGNIMDNPNRLKYSVFSLDGKCLESRLTLEQAEDFCNTNKGFM